ncbi:protein deadpan-like [Anthonomus grandis grandis]|uniref:protein deadpan-like n=1 Tax=Anthonomus grandis grandis TaxID=2921223 RepID=UPI002165CB6A|nr:protein deadpan-like [Anthonomus grandis grandis]
MPISEDEFDSSNMQEPQVNNMSKAELRKTHKPIMEKRRRARINNCLNEIKNLILEAMNKDPARHTKLEKADILEMAVKHLQNVQRQQLAIAMATDPSVIRKFKSGFSDCATEIDRFIGKSENSDRGIRDRVTNHLQKCMTNLDQVAQFPTPAVTSIPLIPTSAIFPGNPGIEGQANEDDQNNNPRIQIPQGIQLIPSRLPTGELALLVPNSSNLPYFPTHSQQQRPSAFASVTPQSPPLSPVEVSKSPPKGFRPPQPIITRPKPSYPGEDHQVPQITSTVGNSAEKHQFAAPLEVKSMKFPIHKPLEKERHTSVIRKISEPLCVITNQGERYRLAQQKDDSAFLEENQIASRGVKRVYSEMIQQQSNAGILTIAPQEAFIRPPKIIKTSHHTVPSSSFGRPDVNQPSRLIYDTEKEAEFSLISANNNIQPTASSSGEAKNQLECQKEMPEDNKNQKDEQNDMWRPW